MLKKNYIIEAESIRQFALMQEKVRTMEAEIRRLTQENTTLKNQSLDKDKPESVAPQSPKGRRSRNNFILINDPYYYPARKRLMVTMVCS